MSQPLISIIVPVYNGEKYLRHCLDSIVAQRFTDWELLVVDDGSTDGSPAILDDYAARDGRIRVVHKPNGGQALARNEALQRSKGEFISFIDCDDWLEPDMYERMMVTMEEEDADIVICGYTEEFVGRQKVVNGDGGMRLLEMQEALRLVLEGHIGSYLWSMLFRKTVVREPMPLMRLYEDHATIFKWVSHAKRVTILRLPLYHYRQRQSSSLHGRGLEDNFYLKAIKERYDYVAEHHLLPGWEAENRRLLLRGCIKHAKDLARLPQQDDRVRAFIVEVREVIGRFRPIRRQEVGTKYWLRLGLLLANVDWFVRILRLTAAFSLKGKKTGHQLYP